MSDLNCNFCKKEFKNKYIFDTHQKTSKTCLKLQGIVSENFKCQYCHKCLSSQTRLTTHINICKKKIKEESINEKIKEKEKRFQLILKEKENMYKEKEESLNEKIKEKDILIKKYQLILKEKENICKEKEEKYKELIEEKEEKYNELKKMFEKANDIISEIAKQPKTINTSNNNDNRIKTQNNTQTFDVNDIKRINNILENNLTPDVLSKGQKGIAEMLKKHLLQNERGELIYECTDVSRQKFEFVNLYGFIESDPKAAKLLNSLNSANIFDVTHSTGKKLWEKEDGTINHDAQNIHILKVGEVLEINNDSSKFRTHLANITYNKEKNIFN